MFEKWEELKYTIAPLAQLVQSIAFTQQRSGVRISQGALLIIKFKIMSAVEFAYWLQGFFEISEPNEIKELNETQTRIIKDHLQLVFKKETPAYSRETNHGNCGTCGIGGISDIG